METGYDHQHSAAVDEAATWYAANSDIAERPLVPLLQREFGLTAAEACAALAEGGRRRRHEIGTALSATKRDIPS